jgi:Cobalamin biosynthesis protein CbiK, Co2+ chelatase
MKLKKMLTALLSVAVILTMSVPVFAADTTTHPTSGTDTATAESADVISDLGMFTPVTGTTVTVKSDATVDVTLVSKAMTRQYQKLALTDQTKTDAQKNKAAVTATVTQQSDGKYVSTFKFSIAIEQLGKKLPISLYQKFTKEDGTAVDGWYNMSEQHYITVMNTPNVVAQLTDAIYYQERTAYTDRLCKQAKASWDALTAEQQKAVPDFGYYKDNAEEKGGWEYFGLNTGDASLDDALNENNIGKKELLVASFGTSFNSSRIATIGGVEKALKTAYKDYSVRRGFTSQIIINHIQARDSELIDNMDQALDRAVANGVRILVVQPTQLMHGAEYDELTEEVMKYKAKFQQIIISEPLCSTEADKERVAKDIYETSIKEAGFKDATSAAASKDTAFVFMGHGTSHQAQVLYDQMQEVVAKLGYANCFIGTVEGKPADTSCESVIKKVKAAGYKNVILRPLMVVAGDHANNDMAGDDSDSWKSQFTTAGFSVKCQIEGLGQIADIQQLYVEHAKEAIAKVVTVNATYIKSVKSGAAGVKVTLAKKAGMSGYQIRYSSNSKFKSAKTVTLKSASSVSKMIKNLKSGGKYYFQARSYKTSNGTKYYSAWSKTKVTSAL